MNLFLKDRKKLNKKIDMFKKVAKLQICYINNKKGK